MKRYDYGSPEHVQMQSNQRLFLLVVLFALLIITVCAFIALCWYFFGPIGGKIALGGLVAILVFLSGWLVVMSSINAISNVYRDAMNTIVEFQAADDRGEAMRHLANVVKSGNQLDKSVLSLAGNLAKGQARALVDHRSAQMQAQEQQSIESEWWNVPSFGDSNE